MTMRLFIESKFVLPNYFVPHLLKWLLYNRSLQEGYHWVDGTQSGYENWEEGYPNSLEGREKCVSAYKSSEEHKWSNANCNTKMRIICETIAQEEPFTTAPMPTRPPSIPCHPEDTTWIKKTYEDEWCYAFMSKDQGLTWRKARDNCTGMGGELVSIHSVEENNFIQSEV